MKLMYLLLAILCFDFQVLLAQNKPFEGVLEYISIATQDSIEKKTLISNLRDIGWNDFAEDVSITDSIRTILYVKGDTLWGESYINDQKQIKQIYYQVGLHASIIVPKEGSRVILGNTREIEEFLDSHTNENWREKVNVNEWFKLKYDKFRQLKNKTKRIQGYTCTLYRYSDDHSNSTSNYWITQDISVSKDQVLPYFFEGKITPFGVVLETEWESPKNSHWSIVRNIKIGSVDPILPRLKSINFGTLDSIQYADEKMNQHLNGKTIEYALVAPNFSFYPVGETVPMNLYAKQGNGKFILLDLWSTWCGPCIKAFPLLRQLGEENVATLEIIGLNIGDHREDFVQEFINKHNMNWSQAYGGRLLRAFLNPKKSIPYAILLDHEMKVRWMGNPTQHWGEIEKIIRQ